MKQRFSSSNEQRETTAENQQQQQQQAATAGRTFESVEEMLRHDASQVRPPDTVAVRLQASLAREPDRPASWWRRLWPW
jgi:hypothetical protein